jgi:sugar lactone lactonase YvrE
VGLFRRVGYNVDGLAEGPAWRADDGGYLLFSDLNANELKRWDRAGGVRTFRSPSGNANGNTIDREGRLLSAEHASRISRTEKDDTVVTVIEHVQVTTWPREPVSHHPTTRQGAGPFVAPL